MKANLFTSTCLPLFLFLLFCMIACNQQKEKSAEYVEKNVQDTLNNSSPHDSQTQALVSKDTIGKEEHTEYEKPVPKICQPNFNVLSIPKKDQKIIYVSGFNPLEFKCWEELELYGQQTCKKQPCVIYYMDSAVRTFTTSPPHFMNENTLKEHGIGRFENTYSGWELKGSSQWGRKAKGYAYYNTNAGGGG